MTAADWLARLRHDLVKRLVWPARDRRELGGAPGPGELVPRLVDDEGRPTDAGSLWRSLAEDAPPSLRLDAFAAALAQAIAAAEVGDVDGVLALDAAFEQLAGLARSLDPSPGEKV
jgi:hypothetical protein